ncbi:sortase [Allostreptomyces psammosilenae]|uniref:LPXTG-site transpeptidase (Sortase) family protein n=1 Tax=Allostreptomyces psammosilenae TaxID=1892865 RepID=A0A852ZWE8_9ACTN|nr:sortase [Allostreptomyces psammosilenae]NYI06285.1 LPXTG-site transpeptidase (sortase) family protein [Allostreptomyces psammosilenae]
MTLTTPPPAAARPPAAAPVPAPPRAPAPAPPTAPKGPAHGTQPPPAVRGHLALYLPGTALTILGALLIGFVAHLTVVSGLQHNRDQQLAWADFRFELAAGIAPVSQQDFDGKLVPVGTAVAVIEIPQIGVREVVFEGTDGATLRSGPGHRRDTTFPGQPGMSTLMGRHDAYGGPFNRIEELRAGDAFTVTTGQGEHTYEVIGVRRAGDPVPAPPEQGAGRLTLITAEVDTPFVPEDALYVDADLTSAVMETSGQLIQPGSAPEEEDALATDTGGMWALVLWLQALVLAAVAVVWLHRRRGATQAWLIGVPVLLALGLTVADSAALLLPNLL